LEEYFADALSLAVTGSELPRHTFGVPFGSESQGVPMEIKHINHVRRDASADVTESTDKRRPAGTSVKIGVICGSLPVP
jgi:hypothetical protein